MPYAAQSLMGLILIPLMAWAFCENRAAVPGGAAVRICAAGLTTQFVLALVLLRVPETQIVFQAMNHAVHGLETATNDGLRFVFGYLAGGPTPFDVVRPEHSFLLAFRALPLILILSVLSRLLYHWGILQRLVGGVAWALRRSLGISGPLGTAAAATVFLGMVEGPLVIRPFLPSMGRGALFATMTVGMATVAGTVLALYASVLEPVLPGAAGHVLVASILSVPAALTLARLMVPDGFAGAAAAVDDSAGAMAAGAQATAERTSAIDVIAQGTADGLKLLAYVVAMLVVMLSLVSLANAMLGAATKPFGVALTFQSILGWLAAPLAWLIGIPWSEAKVGGSLIGIKTVLNELVAFIELSKLPEAALSPRSRLILTYALCGFANLGSLGIMIGGLTAMVPERRMEIAAMGARAVLAGGLATLMSAAMVGLVVWQ